MEFAETSPQQTTGRFNGFLKSVILRISGARDLGDVNRYQFYDHMKVYIAAPPDVLRVDEKNLPEHNILNCCGVIITTNYKTDGIHLPADDRRHFVAWSSLTAADFESGYWNDIYGWYSHGGVEHVAAYLATLDLSDFDPKAPPPKTMAFWEIVDANRAPEDAELGDVLERLATPIPGYDQLRYPDTVTISQLGALSPQDFADWLLDRRNSRRISHRLEACG